MSILSRRRDSDC